MKEWSNVLDVSFSSNQTNTPISGYTKEIYGDGTKLVGISCANVGHTPPVRTDDDLTWFGLPGSGSTPPASTGGNPPATSTGSGAPPATSAPSGGATSAQYGQW